MEKVTFRIGGSSVENRGPGIVNGRRFKKGEIFTTDDEEMIRCLRLTGCCKEVDLKKLELEWDTLKKFQADAVEAKKAGAAEAVAPKVIEVDEKVEEAEPGQPTVHSMGKQELRDLCDELGVPRARANADMVKRIEEYYKRSGSDAGNVA
jgi:hypothetical protein